MLEAPSETVEAPADQHIETPPLGVPDQLIEGRTLLDGPADPLIDVLPSLPASSVDESPKLPKLVLVCAFRGYPVSDSDNIRSLNPI